jgi:hypothetical protein
VHLHRVGTSSGTCGCIGSGFSCYFWRLLPPRWLGADVGEWHELEIVCGHPDHDCEGFLTFSQGEQKVLYWIARVIELPSLWLGSCSALEKGLALCQLAHEPPSVWSTQWGLVCR